MHYKYAHRLAEHAACVMVGQQTLKCCTVLTTVLWFVLTQPDYNFTVQRTRVEPPLSPRVPERMGGEASGDAVHPHAPQQSLFGHSPSPLRQRPRQPADEAAPPSPSPLQLQSEHTKALPPQPQQSLRHGRCVQRPSQAVPHEQVGLQPRPQQPGKSAPHHSPPPPPQQQQAKQPEQQPPQERAPCPRLPDLLSCKRPPSDVRQTAAAQWRSVQSPPKHAPKPQPEQPQPLVPAARQLQPGTVAQPPSQGGKVGRKQRPTLILTSVPQLPDLPPEFMPPQQGQADTVVSQLCDDLQSKKPQSLSARRPALYLSHLPTSRMPLQQQSDHRPSQSDLQTLQSGAYMREALVRAEERLRGLGLEPVYSPPGTLHATEKAEVRAHPCE